MLAASGGYDELFVAWPPGFGDLAYYQELGMPIVEPEEHPGADGYWETLSWEQADKYDVDMILVDVRSGSLDDLLAQAPDVVARLPATEADQLVVWPAAYAMGYGNVAEIIDGLAAAGRGRRRRGRVAATGPSTAADSAGLSRRP